MELMTHPDTNDFPHRDTPAARMLAMAFANLSKRHDTSLRQLAKTLGYKQGVVLSHMANGRVPIPIDRAVELATETGMPVREFLLAVLHQRYPNVDWSLVTSLGPVSDAVAELETIAGAKIDELPAEQLRVMREVAADARPARRWLSPGEIAVMEMLRDLRPGLNANGLSPEDRLALRRALISERSG